MLKISCHTLAVAGKRTASSEIDKNMYKLRLIVSRESVEFTSYNRLFVKNNLRNIQPFCLDFRYSAQLFVIPKLILA